MNPALPLLALLSLAGWLLRRREVGLPWAVCGLAAMALLAPALSLSDGVPSPSASLAEHAPWQGTGDARAGNPNLRDITHQVEPWLLFLRHELRAGRLPYWDPHQFSGSPFWSNGSGAPLFPLHLLFALLPLQIGLVLLPWLRLVIGGCGAFFLARELGLERPASLLAALAYPLSGMITGFLLFPMANCHALVPWVFLAVERLAAGRGRWTTLAWLGGLQLLGGHPETPVFTAFLAGIYLLVRGLLVRGTARPIRVWLGFVGAWIVALALAAIQIVPLFFLVRQTGKWLHAESSPPPPIATVGRLLLRLVLPDAFGNPAAGTWWGPYNFIGTALYIGIIPLVLALAALWRRDGVGRDRRWIAVAVMTVCALAGAYHLPGARQILLALPVIQRGIHHYLKFGVELGLALLAALGFQIWLGGVDEPVRRKSRAFWLAAGTVVALLGLAFWRFEADWRAHHLASGQEIRIGAALLLIAALMAGLVATPRLRRILPTLVLGLAVIDLCAAHAPTQPGLSVSRLYPRTGAIRFLAGRPERFAASGTVLRPDAAMVYGLYDIRGDSPVKLERYDRIYGTLAAPDPVYFRPIRDWSSPWLDRWGVRWAVFGPGEAPPAGTAWRLAYAGADAKVYERQTALPLVRIVGGPVVGPQPSVRVERRAPGFWRIAWSGAAGQRLVVAETWDAGWHAVSSGREVPVEPEDEVLLGVQLSEPAGTVELRYRPPGIVAGAVATFAALALLLGLEIVTLRSRVFRRSNSVSTPAP